MSEPARARAEGAMTDYDILVAVDAARDVLNVALTNAARHGMVIYLHTARQPACPPTSHAHHFVAVELTRHVVATREV